LPLRYISNAFDKPRFTQHFRAEAPLDIRALLYVPEQRPGLFDMARDGGGDVGVSLYCRKVLIKSKAENVVPRWMRFVKGVVDSEDIPLNLSRCLYFIKARLTLFLGSCCKTALRFASCGL